MRVTIIPADRMVYVNGDARKVDDHIVFPDVHAIQWYGDHGEIEHIKHVKPNEIIESIEPYQHLVDHHAVVSKREDAISAEREERLKQAKAESAKSLYPPVEDLIRRIEALEKKIAG